VWALGTTVSGWAWIKGTEMHNRLEVLTASLAQQMKENDAAVESAKHAKDLLLRRGEALRAPPPYSV
jgi:hypothetical protein